MTLQHYINAQLSPYEQAITALMSRGKIPSVWGKKPVVLKPEELICVQFADEMRLHVKNGNYNGIWWHNPNEGRRGKLTAIIMKAMGLLPGLTDYAFVWKVHHDAQLVNYGGYDVGMIEFKRPEERYESPKTGKSIIKNHKGQASKNQLHFKTWCEHFGIQHAQCYSVEEAMATLKSWGALV